MLRKDETTNNTSASDAAGHPWREVDSRFRLVIMATLRSKQLLRGAAPRIVLHHLKQKNTSIALEEVKQGLVLFTISGEGQKGNGGGGKPEGT